MIQHKFVELIPKEKEPGILYISLEYAVASHLCACGCGELVVTSLAPRAWSMTFDGETVSLNPSIGNWSLPCKSHYWIRKGQIRWARTFDDSEIAAVRSRNRKDHNASGKKDIKESERTKRSKSKRKGGSDEVI